MRIIRLLLLACFAFVFIGCSTTTVRHSKDYQSYLDESRNYVVLPPEATVSEIDISGTGKRLYNFEYNIEIIIAEQIIPILNDKGFRAKLLTRKDIHDQKINIAINRLDEEYQEISKKLYKEESISEDKAFNIDMNVGNIISIPASQNNADIAIIASYIRSIKSSGSQALGFAAALVGHGSEPADIAKLQIAFINAKTGEILWVNRSAKIYSTFFSSDSKELERKIIKEHILLTLKPLKK